MNIKELYDNNVNIMEYFREKLKTNSNSINSILTSYDLQAGSYTENFEINETLNNFHINGEKVSLNFQEYNERFCEYIANEISHFEFKTICEAGVGEATCMAPMVNKLKNKKIYGFDIAPSRIAQANKFIKKFKQKANLIVANLLQTPYPDNAFDIVYTIHAIEPNTLNAESIIKELYRITNKVLILVEPSYELGNDETKKHIDEHKYIKNLYETVKNLGYKVIKYELCPIGTYNNQPAIIVIEKNLNKKSNTNIDYVCPICHKKLLKKYGNYFCNECYLVYPTLKNIEMLIAENGILFTQYIQ